MRIWRNLFFIILSICGSFSIVKAQTKIFTSEDRKWSFQMALKEKSEKPYDFTVTKDEKCQPWKFSEFFLKSSCEAFGRHFDCESKSGKYRILGFPTREACLKRLYQEKGDAGLLMPDVKSETNSEVKQNDITK
jgi:hypothetical protein